MRRIYSTCFYLAIPFILLRLLFKAKQNRAYLQRWRERFALFPAPPCQGAIWVHSVSVGETMAAIPLIKKLQEQYAKPIMMTTMTPTGSERVQAVFGNSIFHIYIPYDLPGTVKRFLKKIQPSMVIFMETELWPNYLYYCHKQHIPLLLANARLSENSKRGYALIGRFAKKMLNQVTLIAAQHQADAQRFIELGADPSRVTVAGNMKFDIHIPASAYEQSAVFQDVWGRDRLIFCAASTHEGEEEIILQAFKIIKRQMPNTLLVLVPRHPERFNKVYALCKKLGYEVRRRSEQKTCTTSTDIFLGDSMGELLAMYAACDVVFVGGSLVSVGGHNLLEPAALAKPTVTGPHVFNFSEISRLLIDAGAVTMIQNAEQLAETVTLFLTDSEQRREAGARGLEVVEQNRGALEKHLELIGGLRSVGA